MATSKTATPKYFEQRASCPGCESTRSRTLYRAPYGHGPVFNFLKDYYRSGNVSSEKLHDAAYVLDECLDCSLSFQRFIPNAAFLDEIYDRWLNSAYHPEKDPSYAEALGGAFHSRDGHEIAAIAAVLGRPIGSLRVLDFGMGWGLWARTALALGCASHGFDLSENRRAYARQHGISVVDTHQFAGLELDFVNAEQVFEHLTTPLVDAMALSRSLRLGGILKIAVPQAPDLERRLNPADWNAPRSTSRWLNAVHPLEHVNCWTPKALETLARRAGMEPVQIPLRAYFAFLRRGSPLGISALRVTAKGLLRPAYHGLSPNNLYRWFRKVREPA